MKQENLFKSFSFSVSVSKYLYFSLKTVFSHMTILHIFYHVSWDTGTLPHQGESPKYVLLEITVISPSLHLCVLTSPESKLVYVGIFYVHMLLTYFSAWESTRKDWRKHSGDPTSHYWLNAAISAISACRIGKGVSFNMDTMLLILLKWNQVLKCFFFLLCWFFFSFSSQSLYIWWLY